MKYTISISQVGIVKAGLRDSTDLVDWAIIGYIKDWLAHPKSKILIQVNCHKEEDVDKRFVWINYKHFLEEMPMLHINNKDTLSRRINKLVKLDLIETHKEPDNTIYIHITEKAFSVWSDRPIDSKVDRVSTRESPAPIDSKVDSNKQSIKSNHLLEQKEKEDPKSPKDDFQAPICPECSSPCKYDTDLKGNFWPYCPICGIHIGSPSKQDNSKPPPEPPAPKYEALDESTGLTKEQVDAIKAMNAKWDNKIGSEHIAILDSKPSRVQDIHRRAARYLVANIAKVHPTLAPKLTKTEKYAEEIEKVQRLDGIKLMKLKEVSDWLVDDWWGGQFKSPMKLRKKKADEEFNFILKMIDERDRQGKSKPTNGTTTGTAVPSPEQTRQMLAEKGI